MEKPETAAPAVSRKEQKRLQAEQRKQLQPLRASVRAAEREMDQLHVRQAELEETLADVEIYKEENKGRLTRLLQEKTAIDIRCQEVEAQWLEFSERLESMQAAADPSG